MIHVILIECADNKGLISKITSAIYKNDLNIIANWEYVDRLNNRFFMRTEVEGDVNKDKLIADLTKVLPEHSRVRVSSKERKKIVIMATREAHCLGDLLVRCWDGGIDADVEAVISNHCVLKDLVDRFDVPYYFLAHEGIEREHHEENIMRVIDELQPDYIILAKYMRILSGHFTERYANRIINIHHSFLPAFIGAKPYQQAFDRGVKIIGATAHFVNSHLDEGPIIAQHTIPVDHSSGPDDMARSGQDVEKVTLAKAVRLVLEDRVFVSGNSTVVFE
jgi:formyltetrahydrofolate deformylase